jgi:hypothetical protein
MRRAKDAGTLLAAVGVAVLAIACCAGLPVLAAVAGLTIATILGVGGGLIGIIAVLSGMLLALRARRRRPCPPPTERPTA